MPYMRGLISGPGFDKSMVIRAGSPPRAVESKTSNRVRQYDVALIPRSITPAARLDLCHSNSPAVKIIHQRKSLRIVFFKTLWAVFGFRSRHVQIAVRAEIPHR